MKNPSAAKKLEALGVMNEAIFASIGDGLIVTDHQGIIVRVNAAFEKLLGWSANEVIGKKMVEVVQKVDERGVIIPPKERSLHRVLTGELRAGRVSTIIKNHSYIRKDKSQLPIAGVATPIISGNKIIGAVQIFET